MATAKDPKTIEKLKICLVAFKFPILGRASDTGFLWPIARGLAQKGHSVTVIAARSPLGKQEVERDGVRVFYLFEGFPNWSHLPFEEAAYLKFLELHSQEPFQLMHGMDRTAYKIGRRKRNLKLPAVAYDVEATQMSQLFSILGMAHESVGSLLSTGVAVIYKFLTTYFGGDRDLLKTADGVFVTSPQQRIFLERYYLYPDYHTYTVPYGIELGDLSQQPEAHELRKKSKIPEGAHIVLTITDMSEPQEMINVLRAFERVAVKKPNTYLVIVGNGPGWKTIEFEMLSLALGSRVKMTGALKPEDVSDWISVADVFLNMSSRTTGFEPAMIEAMAQKKVLIGSEVSPIANIVEDGQDGFLLRPADVDSLSHLLVELFSGSLPSLEIGQRARDKVTSLFDTKKMIQSVEEAYQRILDR
jgi:glycosyltransferase involved in cell wall biosynthesis